MRGALHAWAVLPFAVAGAILVALSTPQSTWPTVGYALSVAACLGTSALYHRIDWSPRWYARMRRLDHAMIFVLIVGTWTPLCLVACRDRDVGVPFVSLCVLAGVGVLLTLFWTTAPKWVRAAIYLLVGWLGVWVIPDVYASMGSTGVVLLATGGALYSIGAAAYALQWPNPRPRVFGYHEIFHAFVILAAGVHYALVAVAVV